MDEYFRDTDIIKQKFTPIWKSIRQHQQAAFYLLIVAIALVGCEESLRSETEKTFFVNKTSLSMFIGDEYKVTASPIDGTYNYRWSSEDPAVATVDNNGLIKAVGEGNTFILVEADGLTNRIEVTSLTKIILESVLLSETELELFYGDEVRIIATYYPENYNYASEIVWYSENPEIATVVNGEVKVTGEGTTNIVFKSGNIEEKVSIDGKYTRPFKGPHILSAVAPYELPAANFDFGGEGLAFHDNEPENRIGAADTYRMSNGDPRGTPVEIEGNGSNIGYTAVGEWLVYTVEVHDAGEYLIEAQTAGTSAGSFHIEVNNVNVTGTIPVPNTGAWGTYVWTSTPQDKLTVSLTEGTHRIMYYFEGGHNFRSLRFTKK